jgi:hypothetical protein
LLLEKQHWRGAVAESGLVLGGFFTVVVVLHAAFRYLGNWEDFWLWGWQYNFTLMEGMTWRSFTTRLVGTTPRFILVWLGLWVPAVAAIRDGIGSSRRTPEGQRLAILWLGGSALAVCAGGRFFGHYFIQLLPPLCVLAALRLAAWWSRAGSALGATWKRGLIVAALAIPPMVYLVVNWQEELRRMNGEPIFVQEVAAAVQGLTTEDERIVVWGRMPELYYFAERLPGTRFITVDWIVGMNPYNYADGNARLKNGGESPIGNLFLADLTANRPKLIIDTSPENFRNYGRYPTADFPRFRQFIDRNYRRRQTVGRSVIYEIKD